MQILDNLLIVGKGLEWSRWLEDGISFPCYLYAAPIRPAA